jgi:hypothetical protein
VVKMQPSKEFFRTKDSRSAPTHPPTLFLATTAPSPAVANTLVEP